MVWRLVYSRGDVYWNMAMDEAMLLLRERNVIPNTLRLYVIEPSAVTIGYFQKVYDAVNMDYLLEKNIPFTRRITGGGSVYHDSSGEATYSIVANIDDISNDIMESYRIICMGLVYAIKDLGLNAEFKPINDVVVNGKKVSGSAQTRKKNTLLQHGTLMYNTDLDTLAKVLKAPREKLLAHRVGSIRERVTTLSIELGHRIYLKDVLERLVNGFSKALGVEFTVSNHSTEELSLANMLYRKYIGSSWIYKR